MKRKLGASLVVLGIVVLTIALGLGAWIFFSPFAATASVCPGPTQVCHGLPWVFFFVTLGLPSGALLIVVGGLLIRRER